MDQVGLPIVLAHQLGRTRPKDWRHVRARRRLHRRPRPEDRAGALGEPGGLLAGDDRRRDRRPDLRGRHRAPNGDTTRAAAYERKADAWQRNVERWTATTQRPLRAEAVLPPAHQGPQPDKGTTYAIGDSGPSKIDQRKVVDVSFLELVRLGVKRPDDPAIVNTLQSPTRSSRPASFWHRFSFDGYGERRNGKSWRLFDDDTRKHARPGVADLRRRARRVRAARGPPGDRAAGGDGVRGQRRRDAARAGLGRPRTDR